MTQRNFSKMALLVCFAALAIVSCTKKQASNTVRIGLFQSLTGETATFGQNTRKGAELALEQINAAGGVHGKQLELVVYDTQSKPEETSAVVTKMITQDNVVGIIGEVASRLSLVAADKAMQFKTPMLSSASTNPDVTKKGPYVFRICFIDPFQGEVMAKFASENLNAKTAAVIRDVKQDYSVGLADFFIKAFTAKGGKIVTDISYQSGETDFRAQLTDVKGKKPDVVFIPGYYGDVALIVQQARKLGLNQPLLGGDGWESEDLVKVAGKGPLENTYFSNHYAPDTTDPAAQAFIEAFKAKHSDRPDAMAALGFDAVHVMADALKRSPAVGREELKAALTSTKDFAGVTGKITLDGDRNAVKSAVVLKNVNGLPTFFATVNP